MPVHLLKDLERVKKMILEMGARVEDDILSAVAALTDCNRVLAEQIIANDSDIDRLEVQIEEECLKILALHQPVARDLRFLVAVLKMNSDLERMGDHSANIAERVLSLHDRGAVPVPKEIKVMVDRVNSMVRRSLDSLVEADSAQARAVILSDDEVDDLRDVIFDMVMGEMKQDAGRMEQWVQLLAAVRDLERIADLATNIAQDVIYLVEGNVVRHQRIS